MDLKNRRRLFLLTQQYQDLLGKEDDDNNNFVSVSVGGIIGGILLRK